MRILLFLAIYTIIFSVTLARSGFRKAAATPSKAEVRRPGRVLVIGAAGGTGQQLVTQALERGYSVTAFVRDPAKFLIQNPHLQVIKGDVLDAASVNAAMAGQDAVLCALGHRQYFRPTRILSEGTRNILLAMEAHNVPRMVCETSLGIGDSVGRLGLYYTLFVIPLVLPFYFWDKTRQEQLITASAVEWILVRPGQLTNGEKRGTYKHGSGVGSFIWTVRISRADVADFMLNQLTENSHLRSSAGVCW